MMPPGWTGPVLGGIDEAGRGPVLGPLVVAGVAVADDAALRDMEVRDSKRLTPARREHLDRRLRATSGIRIEVVEIQADELDEQRRHRGLNQIEQKAFCDVGRRLDVSTLYVDAADANARRFGLGIGAALPGVHVVSEHKADDRYPVVAAASIVAKVRRDAAVAQLARRLERKVGLPLGSGYTHDALTRAFLQAWHAQFGDLPEGTRRSWATVKEMLAPRATALTDFAPMEEPLEDAHSREAAHMAGATGGAPAPGPAPAPPATPASRPKGPKRRAGPSSQPL